MEVVGSVSDVIRLAFVVSVGTSVLVVGYRLIARTLRAL